MGVITVWITGMTDWMLATRAPSSRPKAVMASDARNRMATSSSSISTGE